MAKRRRSVTVAARVVRAVVAVPRPTLPTAPPVVGVPLAPSAALTPTSTRTPGG